jgi:hypothetical protein
MRQLARMNGKLYAAREVVALLCLDHQPIVHEHDEETNGACIGLDFNGEPAMTIFSSYDRSG